MFDVAHVHPLSMTGMRPSNYRPNIWKLLRSFFAMLKSTESVDGNDHEGDGQCGEGALLGIDSSRVRSLE